MDYTLVLLIDCVEVFNQITNRTYWSYQENRESKTYTLASKLDKEIARLKELDSSGRIK